MKVTKQTSGNSFEVEELSQKFVTVLCKVAILFVIAITIIGLLLSRV